MQWNSDAFLRVHAPSERDVWASTTGSCLARSLRLGLECPAGCVAASSSRLSHCFPGWLLVRSVSLSRLDPSWHHLVPVKQSTGMVVSIACVPRPVATRGRRIDDLEEGQGGKSTPRSGIARLGLGVRPCVVPHKVSKGAASAYCSSSHPARAQSRVHQPRDRPLAFLAR
eukprot:1716518-Rhodomonas_salina.2